MLANKLLGNSRGLFCRNVLKAKNCGVAERQCHFAVVPPRNKIPMAEKVMYATVLAAASWFIPFWVLYHIPDYQNEDRNVYTGK